MCKHTESFVPVFFGVYIFSLILFFSAVNTTMTLVSMYTVLPILFIIYPSVYRLDQSSILIKIFQNYIQIVGIFFMLELENPVGTEYFNMAGNTSK